ncbi:M48 family metallopeptidase [Ahrensia sp. R2A130]|uniref:tetratricopeptide repeat protein n=1 Tax=Ahrensia sp. R2A130 TaxID=744979 RepID=UPI0001E0F880|nr:adenylate cyclase [Ahrensia sp. R2A130]EFL89205.1 putative adenylate cyclase [Ahrensia sp. R2A130]
MARPPGDETDTKSEILVTSEGAEQLADGERILTAEQREAVLAALDVAVTSPHLAGSRQLSDFLKYVVSKVLSGESEDIKAYSIAVDALGRDESFDPQNSAAVRVAAGRLRQALALHNAQNTLPDEGDEIAQDKVPVSAVIQLQPGSYIPTFEFIDRDLSGDAGSTIASASATSIRADDPLLAVADGTFIPADVQETGSAPVPVTPIVPWVLLPIMGAVIALISLMAWMTYLPAEPKLAEVPPSSSTGQNLPNEGDRFARPRIKTTLITPSASYPEWFKPREAKDAIILSAVRFDDFEFVGGELVKRPIEDDPRDADFHLQVTLYSAGDEVRGYAQLSRGSAGAIVWSRLEVFNKPTDPPIRDMADLAGRRIAPLLSPYSVVPSDMLQTVPERGGMECVLKSHRYFNNQSDANHKEARDCAEAMVAAGTRLPGIYAALTFLYLDEYREGRNALERDPLMAADRTSRKAVELGPESARAYQARLAVHKVVGDIKSAREAGQKALSLNPYDTDIIADYAAWLISQGEADEGYQLLQEAEDLFAARPAWVEVYRYLSAWMTGRETQAHNVARFLNPARSPMVAAVVLMDAGIVKDPERAAEAQAQLRRDHPTFHANLKVSLKRRGFEESVAARIAASIREGLSVAGPPTVGATRN